MKWWKGKSTSTESPSVERIPPGFRLLYTLRGHEDIISEIAWSPDGRMIASGAYDNAIRLWDAQNGDLIREIRRINSRVYNLAWSPDSRILASTSHDKIVSLWDVTSGDRVNSLAYGINDAIYGVAWTPDGHILAHGRDYAVRLWKVHQSKQTVLFEGHSGTVTSTALSTDGQILASGSADKTVRLWDVQENKQIAALGAHEGAVHSVAWSPDSKSLASASGDKTIRIWDPNTGAQLIILEAHTDNVQCVRFSHDGRLLASKGKDSCLRLWRCDKWEHVASINEPCLNSFFSGLAFHPHETKLATLGEKERAIRVWQLDYNTLFTSPNKGRYYRNAKVILLGDSGVGKTALGLVLTGQQWRPTESTHGRHVWQFENREARLPGDRLELRETLLWDLAGQPGYRIVHQLHLKEVAVALVVFDDRSETEPFSGVRYWDRALRQAQRLQQTGNAPVKKFLVAARTDRGGISFSRKRIEAIVREMGFDGYFETSAKEGWRIAELTDAMRLGVNWDALPKVSSSELFQTIKEFLITEKEAGRLLSTADDLYRSFCHTHPDLSSDQDLRAKFEACVNRIENRDLIRRLNFGDYVLLQPEKLDAYASAMVIAALNDLNGLGFIKEDDALAGRFKEIPSDERVPNKELEKLLLIATVEELLRHEIVLKETADAGIDLVFPSQLRLEWPDAPDVPGKSVVFTFEGPVLNIYATLAVRLSHSRLFEKQGMWKNAVSYRAKVGGSCGMYLRELNEGRGELTLFFDDKATESTRYQFADYVATHLQRRALLNSVKRRRIIVCSSCSVVIPDEMSQMRRKRGLTEMNCPVCDKNISLLDTKEPVTAAGDFISEMDRAADAKRARNTAAMIIKGKREAKDYDVFLCHNNKDKDAVKKIGEQLKEQGILPWLDEWELRPGFSWQHALEEQIETIKAAAVFVGSDGFGPWQEMEQKAFLSEFMRRKCPVIPVILPDCYIVPKLPVFLSGMTWVDFRKSAPDPLKRLIWGITDERSD